MMTQSTTIKIRTLSQKKRCQTQPEARFSIANIVTRKEYERSRKLEKSRVSKQTLQQQSMSSVLPTFRKSCKPPRSTYKLPMKNIQNIESRMNSEMSRFNRMQVHKQNIDTQLYVADKLLFEMDKFMLLNLYCCSFQLVETELPDKDISWAKLMKR